MQTDKLQYQKWDTVNNSMNWMWYYCKELGDTQFLENNSWTNRIITQRWQACFELKYYQNEVKSSRWLLTFVVRELIRFVSSSIHGTLLKNKLVASTKASCYSLIFCWCLWYKAAAENRWHSRNMHDWRSTTSEMTRAWTVGFVGNEQRKIEELQSTTCNEQE